MGTVYEVAFQFAYLLFSAVFVGAVWWGTLRMMDKSLGIDFQHEFREIASNDLALAIYFVGRSVALAILYSSLLRVIF